MSRVKTSQLIAGSSLDGVVIRYPVELRWSCVRCTHSCRDMPRRKRNILLTANDIIRVACATRLQPHQFSIGLRGSFPYERRMKKIGGRCVFLQGTRCSIYSERPLICRFYPFYLRRSADGRLHIGFDSACSGIGRGKVRDADFFHSLVKLARKELPKR